MIELLENYPCENKEELLKKEGEHIRNNDCVNKRIAGRTNKEWREDNKKHLKEYAKEYCENNREKIVKRNKKYREDNREKLLEQKKEYYQINKEYIKEKAKEYNKENKEAISERTKEKITCECGCIIRKSDLSTHKKTNKHLELIKD